MNGTGNGARALYHAVSEWLGTQLLDGLKQKLLEAETMFRRTGITFAVYGSEGKPLSGSSPSISFRASYPARSGAG